METSIVGNAHVAKLVELGVRKLVAGKTDHASARCELKLSLRNQGFCQLSSNDDWLNTILDLNTQLRQGCRQYNEGIDKAILDEWPAQELIRVIWPVGALRDWACRWEAVGGKFFDGRMIALKNSPVWQRLGDEFEDGLGNPYPPFAINSGMDVQDITRNEAMAFGIIDIDRQVVMKNVPVPALVLFDPKPDTDQED